MEQTPLVPAGLIFLAVATSVLLVGLLWDRWQRKRSWGRIAEAVKQLTIQPSGSAALAPGSILAGSRRTGARGGGAGDRRATSRPETGPRAGGSAHGRLRRRARSRARAAIERLRPTRSLRRLMEQAAVSWGLPGFVVRAVAFGGIFVVLLLIFTGSILLALPAMGLGAAIPWLHLKRARARRLGRFEEQFPEAVDMLVRAVRAGHPFPAGLKMVVDETSDPIASEFRRIFEEQKFGLSMHESLQGLAARVDLLDVRIFATAVSIQREVGGSLAEILDQISVTIRERFKIQRQVAVYTAQGRMTGILLSLLPVGLGGLLTLINPAYMGTMFREPLGQAMLAGAALLQLIGYGLIRHITTIKV